MEKKQKTYRRPYAIGTRLSFPNWPFVYTVVGYRGYVAMVEKDTRPGKRITLSQVFEDVHYGIPWF